MFITGILEDEVYTSLAFQLGTRGVNTTSTGPKEFVFVQFPASTALAVGDAVLFNSAGVASVCNTTTTTPGDAAGRMVGICRAVVTSLAAAQYGWVQRTGASTLNAAASAVRNTALNTTATAGRLDDDATAGAEVVDGISLNTTVGGVAAVTACTLNFPYVGRTL